MKPTNIYLACPYSDPDPAVREARFAAANRAAANMIRIGYLVFSPISHTHPICLAGELPGDWGFWEAYDRTFIEWCDELWIVKIPGWEQSRGVDAERQIAWELGKPIRYHSPEPLHGSDPMSTTALTPPGTEQETQRPTCSNCPLWGGIGESGGHCRANPPVLVAGTDRGQWPVTNPWHWCGRHPAINRPTFRSIAQWSAERLKRPVEGKD